MLDADVRRVLCPDKVSTERWLEIMATAHEQGLFSTATIMFGHVDTPAAWVRHWQQIIALQERTGGFSEVVPLPFVAEGAPIFRKGEARSGPTWREARLMHAVIRLTVGRVIPNVQASWVKLGHEGAIKMLSTGANDLGGVLINESITRAAGASHGQMWSAEAMRDAISACGRYPQQRNTRYEPVVPRQARCRACRDHQRSRLCSGLRLRRPGDAPRPKNAPRFEREGLDRF